MTTACPSPAATPHRAPPCPTRRRSMLVIGAVSVAVHGALFAMPWHRDAPNNHRAGDSTKVTYALPATGTPATAHHPRPAAPTHTEPRPGVQRNVTARPVRSPTPAPVMTTTFAATTEHIALEASAHDGSVNTANVANTASATPTPTLPGAYVGPGEPVTTTHDERLVAVHPTLILDAVRREFNRTKHYPIVAQRRGWQGDVILGFRVERDGHIDDVRVRSGSGHALLDDSAAETLRRISLRDQTPTLNLDVDVELELPVAYRLVEPG